MKAAVLRNLHEPFTVEPVELADPKDGEVRVKLTASGVCHSDLSISRGFTPMPTPIIIGHEGAGVIDAVGPGVSSVQPGDHVILTWMYPCHRCRECSRGRPAHCDKALMGMLGGGDGTIIDMGDETGLRIEHRVGGIVLAPEGFRWKRHRHSNRMLGHVPTPSPSR